MPAFGDDKVSVLIHTYKHKPLRKFKWLSANMELNAHLMWVWYDALQA